MTLVSIAVCSPLSDQLIEQIEYLIKKGADCSLKDTEERTALHHLASNLDCSKCVSTLVSYKALLYSAVLFITCSYIQF